MQVVGLYCICHAAQARKGSSQRRHIQNLGNMLQEHTVSWPGPSHGRQSEKKVILKKWHNFSWIRTIKREFGGKYKYLWMIWRGYGHRSTPLSHPILFWFISNPVDVLAAPFWLDGTTSFLYWLTLAETGIEDLDDDANEYARHLRRREHKVARWQHLIPSFEPPRPLRDKTAGCPSFQL